MIEFIIGVFKIDILLFAVRVLFEYALMINKTMHTYTHNQLDSHTAEFTTLNRFYKVFSNSNKKSLTKCLVEFSRTISLKYWIEILLN